MADTFMESFNNALRVGHQMESEKRLQSAQQMQQIMQVLQFQKMAQDMQRQEQTNQAIEGLMADPEKRKLLGPKAEALRPFLRNPAVQDEVVKSLMKPAEYINVRPDSTILDKNTLQTVYTSPSKPEKESPKMIGLDPDSMVPVYKNEKSGITYTTDQSGTQKPYIIKKQLKSVTEPQVQFSPVQTTEGIKSFQTKGDGAGGFRQPIGEPERKPLGEAATKEFGALSALKESNRKAISLFKESYVGPAAGRYYTQKEKIATLPEEQVKFYAYVRDNKDMLLRARSGAQINEQEYARLEKLMPGENLPPKNFMARAKRFEEAVDNILTEKSKAYSAQGYDTGSYVPKSGSYDYEYIPGKGLIKAR
jgi:hypothetical protein